MLWQVLGLESKARERNGLEQSPFWHQIEILDCSESILNTYLNREPAKWDNIKRIINSTRHVTSQYAPRRFISSCLFGDKTQNHLRVVFALCIFCTLGTLSTDDQSNLTQSDKIRKEAPHKNEKEPKEDSWSNSLRMVIFGISSSLLWGYETKRKRAVW